MLRSLKNYVANEKRHKNTEKQGGQVQHYSLHSEDVATEESKYVKAEPDQKDLSPAEVYEKRWAMVILERASIQLRAEYESRGKESIFDSLNPLLAGKDPGIDRTKLASQLNMTAGALNVAQKKYRQSVDLEVAATLMPDDDLEEEKAYLYRILAES